MGRFARRVIGAAVLDKSVYEDVEADPLATLQAFTVVLLASTAAGIGAQGLGRSGIEGIATIGIAALIAWAAWAVLIFEIGVRLLPAPETRADVGQLLRTLGFSAAPGMLTVTAALPGVGLPAFAIAAAWMLVSMIVAVQQALDYSRPSRAIAVCLVAWLLALGLVVLLGWFFGAVRSS
jgi:hypothetical protein